MAVDSFSHASVNWGSLVYNSHEFVLIRGAIKNCIRCIYRTTDWPNSARGLARSSDNVLGHGWDSVEGICACSAQKGRVGK